MQLGDAITQTPKGVKNNDKSQHEEKKSREKSAASNQ